MPVAFEESRRLTGPNRHFAAVGAVLEVPAGVDVTERMLHAWRGNVERARAALGWPDVETVWRSHKDGASLAIAAPIDQLYSATEVNEWAWQTARAGIAQDDQPGFAPAHAATWDLDLALATLLALSRAERQPRVAALVKAGAAHNLPVLIDEHEVSIGSGTGSQRWDVADLPDPDKVAWASLHTIPTALVTGSNGKTTCVRLLSAITRANGWRTAHSCTDGLYFDGKRIDSGDYSGPIGARSVLRVAEAQAAILETARGGILRRGLGVRRADVAVVTNISADHYGEYGVHDLDGLAEAKLTLARAIDASGLLVLNGDDPLLVERSRQLTCPIAWFALDDNLALLREHRHKGGATCAVRGGRLRLHFGGNGNAPTSHDLGPIDAMPLSFGGHARYNVANIAASALAAAALGIAPQTIAATLCQFGSKRGDNPGRLQFWSLGGLKVFIDYAHNADGIRGLLEVATALRTDARLGLVMGTAGDRSNRDVAAMVAAAAAFRPDRVILKDVDGYLRGREPGEVPAFMADEFRRTLSDEAIAICIDEAGAARELLGWGRAGDVLVLPLLGHTSRVSMSALLDHLHTENWQPGNPLPGNPRLADIEADAATDRT